MNSNLFRAAVLALLCFIAQAACAADHFEGPNCDLKEPPESAGELVGGSKLDDMVWFQVYPRTSAIGDHYTGCQVLWTWTHAKPQKMLGFVLFKNGKAIDVWPQDKYQPWCRRGEDGRKTGCTLFANMVAASFPAGCYERAAKDREMPRDCTDSFMAEWDLIDAKAEAARLDNVSR
jgi:hypothetical protein